MWAHWYQNWSNEHCSNLVFADESSFTSYQTDRHAPGLSACWLKARGLLPLRNKLNQLFPHGMDTFHEAGASELMVIDGTIKQQQYINNFRPWTRRTIQRNLVWAWERHALYCMEKLCLWGWCHAVACSQPWSQIHRVCLAPDGAVHQRHG